MHIEGGRASDGDRHALLLDKDACKLYELYALYPKAAAGRRLGRDLESALERAAARGLDVGGRGGAADLPRARALRRGRARHDRPRAALHRLADAAARTSIPRGTTRRRRDDPALPPMGLRVRLKASVDISGFPRQARIVLQALKTYGMILADNGSNWYISGAPNPHWSNDDLHSLGRITGSDFEVVDTSSLPHPGQ